MTIENILNDIEDDAAMLGKGGNEIPSSTLGEMTLHKLHDLDKVAYIRFASVYRKFESMDEFIKEIGSLEDSREVE
jgi:transcriptional repressor NrdR